MTYYDGQQLANQYFNVLANQFGSPPSFAHQQLNLNLPLSPQSGASPPIISPLTFNQTASFGCCSPLMSSPMTSSSTAQSTAFGSLFTTAQASSPTSSTISSEGLPSSPPAVAAPTGIPLAGSPQSGTTLHQAQLMSFLSAFTQPTSPTIGSLGSPMATSPTATNLQQHLSACFPDINPLAAFANFQANQTASERVSLEDSNHSMDDNDQSKSGFVSPLSIGSGSDMSAFFGHGLMTTPPMTSSAMSSPFQSHDESAFSTPTPQTRSSRRFSTPSSTRPTTASSISPIQQRNSTRGQKVRVNKKRLRRDAIIHALARGEPVTQRIRRRKTRNGSPPDETEFMMSSKGGSGSENVSKKSSISTDGIKEEYAPQQDVIMSSSLASSASSSTSSMASQVQLPSPTENEQQLTTPDDPVIHSPPSFRLSAGNVLGNPQMPGLIQGVGSQGPVGGSLTTGGQGLGGSNSGSFEDINRPRRSKTCRVCGDHATGYNFNVITCESCKAFFRRNALRPKNDFKCPYSEDCEINSVSRRFCQKCRLKKCFDVGMKKEWILNEEQLKRRKNSRLNSMKSASSSLSPPRGSGGAGGPSPIHHHQPTMVQPQAMPMSNLNMPASMEVERHRDIDIQRALAKNKAIVEGVTTRVIQEVKSPLSGGSNEGSSMPMNFSIGQQQSATGFQQPAMMFGNTPLSGPMSSGSVASFGNILSEPSSMNSSGLQPINMSPGPQSVCQQIMHQSPSQQIVNPNSNSSTASSMSPPITQPIGIPIIGIPVIPISYIIDAMQRHRLPRMIIKATPNPPQVAVICVFIHRLIDRIIVDQLCMPQLSSVSSLTSYTRISLSVMDYAKLTEMCAPNLKPVEVETGDIYLPDDSHQVFAQMISDMADKALQNTQANLALASQNGQMYHPTWIPCDQPPPAHQPYHPDDYTPACMNVRSQSLINAQYDDITSLHMGPTSTPKINLQDLSPTTRQAMSFIEKSIVRALETESPTMEDTAEEPHSGLPPVAWRTTDTITPTQVKRRRNELRAANAPEPLDPNAPDAVREAEARARQYLNQAELAEIAHLRKAFEAMSDPVESAEGKKALMKTDHTPEDIMNIMDITIRRIVRTMKRVKYFQHASQDGKLFLLRGSSMIDMLTLRGVFLMDEENKCFKTNILGFESKIDLSMFDHLSNPYQRHRFVTFASMIHPVLRKNSLCIMFIAMLVLFDGTRSKKLSAEDRALAMKYQPMYWHLMQRYVEAVYSWKAPEMLKTVPDVLHRLNRITETSIYLFAGKVDPKNCAALPAEFFKMEIPNVFEDPIALAMLGFGPASQEAQREEEEAAAAVAAAATSGTSSPIDVGREPASSSASVIQSDSNCASSSMDQQPSSSSGY